MSDADVTLEGFAHSLPDRYVRCRELGHVWKPSAAKWISSQRVYERVLRCSSCRTEKLQLVSSKGHIVSSHYRYAANYLAQHVKGLGGGARDAYRLEAITRWLESTQNG